ncbi:Histone-lysine N-methyltransferase SETMAR [Eumeta japonica]|uniref:Histone-lysine N-methyltransferase SETMAR n=1 Tax=Eumeta variegata TaxID=151549 RepID=A0A4C1TEK3_EUMVA|nr:Histone-lysine N-methyltransferase SETMAR [Eumeta japonica]
MGEFNVEIRYILKFHLKKGKNATQAVRRIMTFIELMSLRVAQNWFKRFQSGYFDVKDESRSSRPVTDKVDAILKIVDQGRHINFYDIAEELRMDHKTVLTHLNKAGYTKKLDTWAPYKLTGRNLINSVLVCDFLLKCNETEPFLKRLITGDEK